MGFYFVRCEAQEVYLCRGTSKFRKTFEMTKSHKGEGRQRVGKVKQIAVVDPVAVGDWVMFEPMGGNTGKLLEVLPRANQFSRRAPRRRNVEQVIVTNVDQILAVFAAAEPEPQWNLLDRYLVSAEASGIPITICITKLDLMDDEEAREWLAEEMAVYTDAGYTVMMSSAETGEGIEALRENLRGKMSVLVGSSGVGKSTLINSLEPEIDQPTLEISDVTGKGRHTTTMLEMFDLKSGGQIVDTPGMREFGLWESVPAELQNYFPEFRPFLGQCRFEADCTHTEEPECAIKEAVEAEAISGRRYHSYLTMLEPDRG